MENLEKALEELEKEYKKSVVSDSFKTVIIFCIFGCIVAINNPPQVTFAFGIISLFSFIYVIAGIIEEETERFKEQVKYELNQTLSEME